jgi:hypothetical protein
MRLGRPSLRGIRSLARVPWEPGGRRFKSFPRNHSAQIFWYIFWLSTSRLELRAPGIDVCELLDGAPD